MVLDNAQLQATLKQRYNFAVQHMMAAARFTRHCYQVENDNVDQPFGPFFDEILSYVSGTILSSIASLEANINEIFADVQDGHIVISGFDTKVFDASWEEIEKLPILEKYEKFFELATSEKLDKSGRHYQFIKILISVRNSLVHYKPKWHDEQKEHLILGKQLQGKFKFSPFVGGNAPIFPMRCMTHNFAEWALESSLAFAAWFTTSVGVPNRFDKFSEHLNTKPK